MAGGGGADAGVFSGERELVGGLRGGAQFAVDLVEVGMGDEGIEQRVCRPDGVDGVGGEEGWKALLPVVVTALDFALCMGRGA
jgi:hypothetical protein